MHQPTIDQARAGRAAARILALSSDEARNLALINAATGICAASDEIIRSNREDVENGRNSGLSSAMLDRLALTAARISAMAEGLRQIASLPDPLGCTLSQEIRPNGLEITRITVPIGVIGIIYESRPNVTVDSAGLCIKSGNAAILRGGSEAIETNRALAKIIRDAIKAAELPADAVQLIDSVDRDAAITLMQADGLVDLLIPRGGEGLKKTVLEHARVPVLTSLGGNCHTFIDSTANLQMAADIAVNAKVSRPSVCNAMETLLVHASIAHALLPALIDRLIAACVEVRGCERTCGICPKAIPASQKDWETEYLDMILAVRVVDSLEDAIAHIHRYGTGHSEAIVTGDAESAEQFKQQIDAACVFVNASTRFTDGFEFGMGAEVGISTQKLHARGPIGLRELTTYKTIVIGNGQIRA